MEDRQKVLYILKKMKEERQETIKRVTSDYGTQLRMNRSIQAEGSFANIKEDMEFRRYLYRRKANVTAQSILLAIGYNINKLHHKIQAGRTGRHLFPLKQTAWFWQVKSKSWKRTFFQKRFIKVRLLVETEWKERIFRLKNGKKMLPHLWFPNHWCDSPRAFQVLCKQKKLI